jgi:hypothetical protein
MTTAIPQHNLHQDCLDKLGRVLDLVLQTAEAASAENNHKIVIQAAREATRLVTVITKMTSPKNHNRSARSTSEVPSISKNGPSTRQSVGSGSLPEEPEFKPENFILPDLDHLFPPVAVAAWDIEAQDLYRAMTKNYLELQLIGQEMAAALPAADGNATGIGEDVKPLALASGLKG